MGVILLSSTCSIRFKNRGHVVTIDGFDPSIFPTLIPQRINKSLDILDLTGYSVIFRDFKANYEKSLESLMKKARSRSIIVFTINGSAGNIALPSKFNNGKIRFCKQTCHERYLNKLKEDILLGFPHVKVSLDINTNTVIISADQETYSNDPCWIISAKSINEATDGIKRKRQFWKMWNEMVLRVFDLYNIEIPKFGSIKIKFYQANDFQPLDTASIRLPEERGWFVFEKVGDTWVEG